MKIHHNEHNLVKHLNFKKLLIFLILSMANMDYEINSLIVCL